MKNKLQKLRDLMIDISLDLQSGKNIDNLNKADLEEVAELLDLFLEGEIDENTKVH